jgi:hypothetical protein
MTQRQVGDANHVWEPNVEEREAVESELLGNEPVQPLGQAELAETELDRQLSAAGDAEQDLVLRTRDGGSRPAAHCGGSFNPAKKGVRVEEQLHVV